MPQSALKIVLAAVLLSNVCAVKSRLECDALTNCESCSFENCRVSNFTAHTSNPSQVLFLTFRELVVTDVQGCTQWLQQLAPIRHAFWIEHSSREVSQCLRQVAKPLAFSNQLNEFKLKNLPGVDEAWLRSGAVSLFSNLRDKSVEELELHGVGLQSAKALVAGLQITNSLNLVHNRISVLDEEDLDGYGLQTVETIDLSNNKICVLHLRALRGAPLLQKLELKGNPAFAPSRSILKWRSEFASGVMLSSAPECVSAVQPYVACRLLSVTQWNDTYKRGGVQQNVTSEVKLVGGNGAPQCALTRGGMQNDAAVATGSDTKADDGYPAREQSGNVTLKECPSQADCSVCKFRSCRLTDYTRHSRTEVVSVETLDVERVTLSGAAECAEWMQQLGPIGHEFRLTDVQGNVRECLQQLAQPLAFGPNLASFRLGNLPGVDEAWLRSRGATLFSALQNCSIDEFKLERLGLRSATSPFGAVRITRMFSLWRNEISVVGPSAFDAYDAADVQTLQITHNNVCAFHLAALRGMKRLQHVGLEDNPLFVPSDVLLRWLRDFPNGLLVSNATKCRFIAPDCANCRVENVSAWTFDFYSSQPKTSFVMLLVPDEKGSTRTRELPPVDNADITDKPQPNSAAMSRAARPAASASHLTAVTAAFACLAAFVLKHAAAASGL